MLKLSDKVNQLVVNKDLTKPDIYRVTSVFYNHLNVLHGTIKVKGTNDKERVTFDNKMKIWLRNK